METVTGPDGVTITRRVLRPRNTVVNRKAIRRFVAIGLYTGTRNAAMRELSWLASEDGGCLDLDGRYIHRRGFGRDPSVGKPRASSRLARKMAGMAKPWRDADLAANVTHVIHQQDGAAYSTSPSCVWAAVMADAGLGEEVVPHVLRHTAATWLRIGRTDVRAAADLLGMSVQAVVRIYGQWTLEGQDTAADELGYGKGLKTDVFVGGKKPKPTKEPAPKPPVATEPFKVTGYLWTAPAWAGLTAFAQPVVDDPRRDRRRRARRITAAKRNRQVNYLQRDTLAFFKR